MHLLRRPGRPSGLRHPRRPRPSRTARPPARTWVLQLDVQGRTRRWSPSAGAPDRRLRRRPDARPGRLRRRLKRAATRAPKPARPTARRSATPSSATSLGSRPRPPTAQSIADAEGDVERYWSRPSSTAQLHSFTRRRAGRLPPRPDRRAEALTPRIARAGLFRVGVAEHRRRGSTSRCPCSPDLRASPGTGPTNESALRSRGSVFPSSGPAIGRGPEPHSRRPRARARADRAPVARRPHHRVGRRCRLDDDEPTLHRPNPKGGPYKAFRVPALRGGDARSFAAVAQENEILFPACSLAFPTDRSHGRVTHIKNAEEDALRGFGYTPHSPATRSRPRAKRLGSLGARDQGAFSTTATRRSPRVTSALRMDHLRAAS